MALFYVGNDASYIPSQTVMFLHIDSPSFAFVLSQHLAERLQGFQEVSVEEIETAWDQEKALDWKQGVFLVSAVRYSIGCLPSTTASMLAEP